MQRKPYTINILQISKCAILLLAMNASDLLREPARMRCHTQHIAFLSSRCCGCGDSAVKSKEIFEKKASNLGDDDGETLFSQQKNNLVHGTVKRHPTIRIYIQCVCTIYIKVSLLIDLGKSV